MTRVMIVVTHLLGVGHLARMAALARALSAAGNAVTLVSGGRPIGTADIGESSLVQLPPVHTIGTDFRTLYASDSLVADAAYLDSRRAALLDAFDAPRPDVLITELFPFGRRSLRDEFLALLEHARNAIPRPVILSSVRDVLNPPNREDRIAEAHGYLARFYDGVLFHGDASVVPLSASWPVTPSLERRLIETGYVHDGERPLPPAENADGEGEIVVSGGGSPAGLPLCGTALAAAELTPSLRWRILIGRGVSEGDFEELRSGAPTNAVVERARPDFPRLLARSALSVSQAGYNTVLDLAATNARSVLVPFAEGGEKEQGIRAGELAARGLAQTLDQTGITGKALATAAEHALTAPKPDWSEIKRDGSKRAISLIADAVHRSSEEVSAWAALDDVLARARQEDRTIQFWWRDDDVIEPTPALDALLERSRRWNVPMALASIPSRATVGLVERLKSTPTADVLVHGWAHTNHAPKSEKAAEFGAHRSRNVLAAEAGDGLARIKEMFGPQAVPAFVPPWNRVDRSFVDALPALGFSGVSTHGRSDADQPNGLIRVNAHWDPIAWKARGGLKDKSGLLRQLTELVEEELATDVGVLEPIGILTHHLVHDAWIDAFLDELIPRLTGSGAVRFVSARNLFSPAA